MAHQNSPTARKVDVVYHELRRAMESAREKIAGMSVEQMSTAIDIIDEYADEVIGEGGDVEALELTAAEFERERARRIARDAYGIGVSVIRNGDSWRLKVGSNGWAAIDRDFATHDEAHAAGSALAQFLTLAGRGDGFGVYQVLDAPMQSAPPASQPPMHGYMTAAQPPMHGYMTAAQPPTHGYMQNPMMPPAPKPE